MALMPKLIEVNEGFIGREYEINRLQEIYETIDPIILVVYGRRRIGKTELLEQTFRDRNILKFEGMRHKTQHEQRAHVLSELAEYLGQKYVTQIEAKNWVQVFQLIYDVLPEGKWTIYFEEVQWLADYKQDFISELKYVWDNYYKNKKELIIIICGSSPSFIINEVLLSEALYNRSQYELPLREFSLRETNEFLINRYNREVIDAYLLVGGIPEYLKWLNKKSSILIGLCENSFREGSYFSNEYKRIFVSSMSSKKHYKEIIEFLAQYRYSTRKEILKHLGITSSGDITDILTDLELCGFVEKYTPYNLKDTSNVARYCIVDAYLQFYYKFIAPIKKQIDQGDYNDDPIRAIKADVYNKWLGFAFERLCRKKHRIIAKILGFGSVQYLSGPYFSRGAEEKKPGYQIDLLFDRDDKVITICEVRYIQGLVSEKVVQEMEDKLEYFPNKKKKTIHKVLITTEGANEGLIRRSYFDQIITIDDLLRKE